MTDKKETTDEKKAVEEDKKAEEAKPVFAENEVKSVEDRDTSNDFKGA